MNLLIFFLINFIKSSYLNQGDVTNIIKQNGLIIIEHKYLTIGSSTFYPPFNNTIINFIIVAGGGGGGSRHSGGGGGGGVIIAQNFFIPQKVYEVKVGKGGLGGFSQTLGYGENGENSSFLGEIAIGGGGGGSYGPSGHGKNGGSGGGASYQAYEGFSNQISSIYGQSYGNKGGKDNSSIGCFFSHGGGGGAGGPGKDGYLSPSVIGGDGGPGIQWIDGKYYGGGGGGAVYDNGKAGNGGIGGGGGANSGAFNDQCSTGGLPGFGQSGGGNGFQEIRGSSYQAGNGAPNTGGGGGGASQYLSALNCYSKGGNGGSGIVIIRYSINSLTKNNKNSLFNFKYFYLIFLFFI